MKKSEWLTSSVIIIVMAASIFYTRKQNNDTDDNATTPQNTADTMYVINGGSGFGPRVNALAMDKNGDINTVSIDSNIRSFLHLTPQRGDTILVNRDSKIVRNLSVERAIEQTRQRMK